MEQALSAFEFRPVHTLYHVQEGGGGGGGLTGEKKGQVLLFGMLTFGMDHGSCGRLSLISLEKSAKSTLCSSRIASLSPSISPDSPRLLVRLLHSAWT